LNKIFLSGNLTRDFEYNSNSSTSWAKSAIAVNRPFAKNNEVDFFNITVFGKTAAFCKNFLGKGRRVVVEGRLQTNNYTDKNGNARAGFDVIVDNIEFADSKKKDNSANNQNDNYTDYNPDDVDVPF
jgi:single-strand DNA-binding protein